MKRFEEGDSVIVTKDTIHRNKTGEVKKVRQSTRDADGNEIGRYEVDFHDGEGLWVYEDDELKKAPPVPTP